MNTAFEWCRKTWVETVAQMRLAISNVAQMCNIVRSVCQAGLIVTILAGGQMCIESYYGCWQCAQQCHGEIAALAANYVEAGNP